MRLLRSHSVNVRMGLALEPDATPDTIAALVEDSDVRVSHIARSRITDA